MDGGESSSTSEQQEHDMDGGKPDPTTSEQQIVDKTAPAPAPEEEDDDDESFDDWDNRIEMFGGPGEEEEDETGESISKRQIRRLCKDLSSMLDYLRLDIEPAAPLRGTMVDEKSTAAPPIIPSLLEQFKDLRRRMHKLRSRLFPFKEWYEEEQAKPESYEGLDEEEKARKMMKKEEEFFHSYRQGTEFSSRRVSFTQQTTLSPMHFTHWTPGLPLPYNAETDGVSLQVYSFKITDIMCGLRWPLHVYGVIAARDNSDRKRNIIFDRPRHNSQKLTADDPFLRLTGPSRAIMALSPVDFEVQLKLKGATECEDRPLMNQREHYIGGTGADGLEILTFENCLCTAELSVEELSSSVQATFVSVRVVGTGPCPFEHGGRVACSSPIHEVVVMDPQGTVEEVIDPPDIVLLDSRDCDCGEMPMGKYGFLHLSRRFVSVEVRKENSQQYKESLQVVFEAYSESGGIAAQAHVKIRPRICNISRHTCDLGGSQVEITLAWSAIVRTDLC